MRIHPILCVNLNKNMTKATQKKISGKNNAPTKLFEAINNESWVFAAAIAKRAPKSAKQPVLVAMENNTTNLLPLHRACNKKPTVKIIETLLQCYPKAVRMVDTSFNRLPLHFACIRGVDEDVVRVLLLAYPDAARTTALIGRLPIHYASANGASPGVIAALLEFYPEGARIADKFGMLPLHLACLQNAPAEVAQLLLEAFPESVYFKTKKGNTVLNCTQVIEDCENKTRLVHLLDDVSHSHHTFDAACNASIRGVGEKQFEPFSMTLTKVESGEFC